jgi:dephospho-CoA kinase
VDLTDQKIYIGLTGGIGSGKSTVAKMLQACGAYLVDLDAISRTLTSPGGSALTPIRHGLGDGIFEPDGSLSRPRLRAKVFADAQAKSQLEAILHPLILAQAVAQAARAKPAQPVVFDIPLLVESPAWLAKVDKVLVIDCSQALQIQRVMQRSGWTREAVLGTIAQQASRAQRLARADAVIVNEGLTLEELQMQVHKLWQTWFGVEQSV